MIEVEHRHLLGNKLPPAVAIERYRNMLIDSAGTGDSDRT
jgi:hypothetical protein